MSDKIKRFFECYIPVTVCNLKCEYCYVPQNHWTMGKMPSFRYPIGRIVAGLSKERLGGICYFSLCGGGETLLPKEVPHIAAGLLKEGHYVNITTNGTCTRGFDAIFSSVPRMLLRHLHFAFSLHYLELKRTKQLDVFVANVKQAKAMGCSFVVQMNLYDGYEPVLQEIRDFCMEEFGALPQVAVTRREGNPITLFTNHSPKEYYDVGKAFASPLFEFTMRNFMVRRKEFCYAGDWSFVADLGAGWIKSCYSCGRRMDIFADIGKPIRFEAVGCGCRGQYCQNSSHFLALGTIPSLFQDVTYASLRNRASAGWYTDEMLAFLTGKLNESNMEYSTSKKTLLKLKHLTTRVVNGVARRLVKRPLIAEADGFER